MQTPTDNERFPPTQPLPEHQDRLRSQRHSTRLKYTPNHVPLIGRTLYALVSLTWIGWAMIGLLSGHMFVLLSKRGPIHLTGAPAVLFSVAVMACAAACAVAIVDHYDKRNNEDSYKRIRRQLWWSAVGFLCLSALVGMAERTGVLPYTNSALGLLSTRRLQSLLTSSWLADSLVPHRAAIEKWSLLLLLWCFVAMLALSKLGLLRQDAPLPLGVALFIILVVIGPAIAAFTLNLVTTLCSGSHSPLPEESLRAQLAWLQSMLLTGVSLLAFFGVLAVFTLLRAIGILPKGQPH